MNVYYVYFLFIALNNNNKILFTDLNSQQLIAVITYHSSTSK